MVLAGEAEGMGACVFIYKIYISTPRSVYMYVYIYTSTPPRGQKTANTKPTKPNTGNAAPGDIVIQVREIKHPTFVRRYELLFCCPSFRFSLVYIDMYMTYMDTFCSPTTPRHPDQ